MVLRSISFLKLMHIRFKLVCETQFEHASSKSFKNDVSFSPAHLTGAVTGTQCLTRLQKKFDKVIVAANLPDAKGLLLNGTVRMGF